MKFERLENPGVRTFTLAGELKLTAALAEATEVLSSSSSSSTCEDFLIPVATKKAHVVSLLLNKFVITSGKVFQGPYETFCDQNMELDFKW